MYSESLIGYFDWSAEVDPAALKARVAEAYRALREGKDAVILAGSGDLVEGRLVGLDGPAVAELLSARALVIVTWGEGRSLDMAAAAREWFGPRLAGVIINRVPWPSLEHARGRLVPFLEKAGIRVFGVLPADVVLGSVSAGELAVRLGAEVLVNREHLDLLVERFIVGAMNLETAMKYLRRARNKAVITGGDRADIQLAALETSTRCLILTGGRYPNEIILSKAREAGVPVMVVRDDTFTTIEKVEAAMGRLHAHEKEKLDRAARIIGEHVDFGRLLATLGTGKP